MQNSKFKIFFLFVSLTIILYVAVLALQVNPVSALEQTPSKNPFNIAFPIPELGNCASLTQCKEYCDIATNQKACMEFAYKKGMQKRPEEKKTAEQTQLLEKAKAELGCTTIDACKTFCEQNKEKCMAFSKKIGQTSTANDEKKKMLLEKAKTELGCNSYESCAQYCKDHQMQCVDFAKKLMMTTKYPSPSASQR